MFRYLKTSWRVTALTTIAYCVVHFALVDIFTSLTRVVHLVTGIAYTPIVSYGVFTSTVGTHGWVLSAFVYV